MFWEKFETASESKYVNKHLLFQAISIDFKRTTNQSTSKRVLEPILLFWTVKCNFLDPVTSNRNAFWNDQVYLIVHVSIYNYKMMT